MARYEDLMRDLAVQMNGLLEVETLTDRLDCLVLIIGTCSKIARKTVAEIAHRNIAEKP